MRQRGVQLVGQWVGVVLLATALVGCSDDDSSSGSDADVDAAVLQDGQASTDGAIDAGRLDGSPSQDGDVIDGGVDGGHALIPIDIYVKGDDSPKTIDDGYWGQTPRNYFVGFSRVDLMKSADDANPVTVFDFGSDYVEVDMSAETKVGTADLFDIPPGVYGYGRALLVMTRFDVDVTVHVTVPSASVPGEANVVAALSDCTIDGQARSQGWAQYAFHVPNYPSVTTEGTLPDLPSTGAGTIVKENGRMWLVFPIDPPLTVAPIPNVATKLTITYDIYESFRWEDQSTEGYAQGVFDSDQSGNTEPVRKFGATEYHIAVE